MFAQLRFALKSKKGIVGAMFLLANLLYGLVEVLGNVDVVVNYAGPILDFLGTGFGVLLTVAAGVILILWALYTQQHESGTNSITPTLNSEQQDEKLNTQANLANRDAFAIALGVLRREGKELSKDYDFRQ